MIAAIESSAKLGIALANLQPTSPQLIQLTDIRTMKDAQTLYEYPLILLPEPFED